MVFLNFLNIRKDYYKPQQFVQKPPTENDTVSFRDPATVFQEHFQENKGFLEILKQIFTIHFPEFPLPTYFLLRVYYENFLLINIYNNIDLLTPLILIFEK